MATFDTTGTNKNKLYHYKVCGFAVNYHTSVQTKLIELLASARTCFLVLTRSRCTLLFVSSHDHRLFSQTIGSSPS